MKDMGGRLVASKATGGRDRGFRECGGAIARRAKRGGGGHGLARMIELPIRTPLAHFEPTV